jgi:hypothetical protein
MFLNGGLRIYENFRTQGNCFGVNCTTTLVVDALGHAGLNGLPTGKGVFPYNATAQALAGSYGGALSLVTMFTFQHACTDQVAAGLSLFYAGLMSLIPKKIVFVMGSGGNYLTAFNDWPESEQVSLFLGENGTLAAAAPSAAPAPASYFYDPSDPAPTYGGNLFQNSNVNGEGCMDQSPLSSREDVLNFDSTPLVFDKAICGKVSAKLTVGSQTNDTDFIARLVDQYPTGERYLVTEGIIRMRWRGQVLQPVAMEAGKTYEVDVDMMSACWIFKAGHRIGLDITSSSSFMYLPNPNTGLPLEPGGIWAPGGEVYKGQNISTTNSVVLGPSKVTMHEVAVDDLPVIDPLPIPSPQAPPAVEELERMGREHMLRNGWSREGN